MTRLTGTTARGIRAPIIREGDDLVSIVADSVLKAAQSEPFTIRDRDVIAITEAIAARAQGNYATVDQIATAIKQIFPTKRGGIVFPILSRNRFATMLKGFARALDHITMQLSYPNDEVGNALVSMEQIDETNINPYSDVLSEKHFRTLFGNNPHPFTKVNYMSLYHDICREEGCDLTIILANDVREILKYEDYILTCDVHNRSRSLRLLRAAGATNAYNLEDLFTAPVDGSGYNPEFGLLGANKATEEKVKLFPRDSQSCVDAIQELMLQKTGKKLEVMVYGDGAFRDPVYRIWELADPVVSPAYTEGLAGTPNEIKLKYIADNEFAALSGNDLNTAVSEYIHLQKKDDEDSSLGTTPRRLFDLLGSLSDLTSGSGDKGTPIVLIQGYFDSYAD